MSESKQDLINEFRERPDLRVLVATEVASEGVDLQFSRLLINYDLPWNPMRVEQRIGRIDRLGQRQKSFISGISSTKRPLMNGFSDDC